MKRSYYIHAALTNLKSPANGGISPGIFLSKDLPGIFLGIFVEMVLAGLKEGYPWNSQEYPSLKAASTISMDIPLEYSL